MFFFKKTYKIKFSTSFMLKKNYKDNFKKINNKKKTILGKKNVMPKKKERKQKKM